MFKDMDWIFIIGIVATISIVANCQIQITKAKYGCKELKTQDSKEFILPDTEAK